MTDLVKIESEPLALRHELSIEEVLGRIKKVHQVMDQAMVEGHHYGKVPGTDKPTLLKPGAELLDVMFRLDPQYETSDRIEGDHLTVTSTCTLWHIPTGQRWGSGQGSCSSRETKYAYRQAVRVCPACGKPAIIKGREEYGGGWLCFKKKEGCGAKFKSGDAQIESQEVGRMVNPDLPDTWNTVRKMANKRSLVAAVLNVTAASDIFTQDLEDLSDGTSGTGASDRPVQGSGAARDAVDRAEEGRAGNIHRGNDSPTDRASNSRPQSPPETIETKADRLFDTDPAVPVTITDRNALLGKITACHDMQKAKGADRKSAWARYVGDYSEQSAPIEKLQHMLAELQAVVPTRR